MNEHRENMVAAEGKHRRKAWRQGSFGTITIALFVVSVLNIAKFPSLAQYAYSNVVNEFGNELPHDNLHIAVNMGVTLGIIFSLSLSAIIILASFKIAQQGRVNPISHKTNQPPWLIAVALFSLIFSDLYATISGNIFCTSTPAFWITHMIGAICILFVARKPRTKSWHVFDALAMLICPLI